MEKNLIPALVYTGAHLGHKTQNWHPKMKPFIYKSQNNIHIIDIVQTSKQLKIACEFLFNQSVKGKKVIIVGTKSHLEDIIIFEATRCQAFWVARRWLGGLLTNQTTIQSRIKKLSQLSNDNTDYGLTKKEKVRQARELSRLESNFAGLRSMTELPDCAIIIDPVKESNALAECKKLNIPTVAVIDTNGDPTLVDYPIPANDDSILSIQYILRALCNAVRDGLCYRLASQNS